MFFYDWCIESKNEYLLQEWNYEKNQSVSSHTEHTTSKTKVWWKCLLCGHEWETAICYRYKGSGCPECAKKKVSVSRKTPSPGQSLEDTFPNVAKEWHSTKNGTLLPSDVSGKSHQKVWWLGECGHEWETIVSSRTNGSGCPYCSGQKVLRGYNDLETLYPSIALEWHPTKNGTLSPSDFTAKSNKKFWWKCPMCDHEWEAKINKRTLGQGCPECAKEWKISFPEKAIVYYLLQTGLEFYENYHADWLNELDLDIYVPSLNLGISYDGPLHQNLEKELRKNSFCERNGTYLIRICDLKCVVIPPFTGMCIRRIDNTDSSLDHSIVTLLQELDQKYGVSFPLDIDINVNRDRISIYELMRMHRKKNSIVSQYPELMDEWDYEKNGNLKPEYLLPGSEKKVWWKCQKHGHVWQAIINSRTRGTGCPICSNNQILAGFNDLATHSPKLASEWHPTKNHPLTPENVSPNSGQKVWWLCEKCGYEWQAAIYSRNGNNPNGCPKCGLEKNISSLRKPKPGNSLLEKNPSLAKEWYFEKNEPYTPSTISFKSHYKAWWLCEKCGHEWQAVVSSRTNGNGCPACYQKRRVSK